jgi:hypothetical protein
MKGGAWKRFGDPVLMVEFDSAQLGLPKETPMAAETDYSQILNLKRGEGEYTPELKR